MTIITGAMQDYLKVFDGMVKIYCEHGALTSDLRMLQREGLVELIHFPYDPNSWSRHIKISAKSAR